MRIYVDMPDGVEPSSDCRNSRNHGDSEKSEQNYAENCSVSAISTSGSNEEVSRCRFVTLGKQIDAREVYPSMNCAVDEKHCDNGITSAKTLSKNKDTTTNDSQTNGIVDESAIVPSSATEESPGSKQPEMCKEMNGKQRQIGFFDPILHDVDTKLDKIVNDFQDCKIMEESDIGSTYADKAADPIESNARQLEDEEQVCSTSSLLNSQKEPSNITTGFEDSAMNSFDILSRCSRTVVLKILGYLPLKDLLHKICLVNKNWNAMAFDPSLWRKIDMRPYVVNDNVLSTLPTLCNFITYIMLPDDKHEKLSDAGLISLARGCPNLRTFYAPRSGSHFTDDAFIAFAEHCKELRELHLDGLEITDRTLQSIALNLDKLEILSLIQAGKFTNKGVAEVIKYCRNLRECILNQNPQITDDCFQTLSQSSKSLQRLEVMMCNIKPRGVPNVGVLHNLVFLNLTQCTELTINELLPVLEGCKSMTALSLNLGKKIDDACIDAIFFHRPNMRKIYLVSTLITDKALDIMGRKGKSLVRIDIGYTKVTAVGARIVSEMCPNLGYLGLMRCSLIRESSVEELVKEFPHIWYSTFLQDTKKYINAEEEEQDQQSEPKSES